MINYPITQNMLRTIQQALAEDIGSGDVTANAIIPINEKLTGHIIAKQDGIIQGYWLRKRSTMPLMQALSAA